MATISGNPRQAARDHVRLLRASADPAKAAASQRFFKEPVPLLGIPAQQQRQAAKALVRRVQSAWTYEDAFVFCESLIVLPHLEIKAAGLLVLEEFSAQFPTSLLPHLKKWLARHTGNWGTVDLLSCDVLNPLLVRHPQLVARLEPWVRAHSLWVRRAAAVGLVPSARRGDLLGAAYRTAANLLDDSEDLIHKATGWLLREAGKSDSGRLERTLLEWGPRIPRTALRYAIERFPAPKRQRILRATRTGN